MDIEFVCFSFNRGTLLLNLVGSIEVCCPCAKITVFDDNSSDRETLRILSDLERKNNIRVIVRPEGPRKQTKVGGLHPNMRHFFERHVRTKYVVYVQDDTQLVRVLSNRDYEYMTTFFDTFSEAGFLYPIFSRTKKSITSRPEYFGDTFGVWFRDEGRKYAGFSAISIFMPKRLEENDFNFQESELESSRVAHSIFGPMAEMATPFVAFMPAPPTYRFDRESLAYRFWGRKQTGCFPIELLNADEVQRMTQCFPTSRPLTRDYLHAPNFKPGHPWPAYRMQGAPRILRWLDRAELKLRRLFS